ncbi:unnamed protein product [Cuscuta epithymum]|uniref:Uncharacterized protein n=1 Tax=Cuscuta epithymum TaxID=186058 RepID=A0AAV0EHW8_9ASTE|nr:unnamed protein product [Cuscuta epithymum]
MVWKQGKMESRLNKLERKITEVIAILDKRDQHRSRGKSRSRSRSHASHASHRTSLRHSARSIEGSEKSEECRRGPRDQSKKTRHLPIPEKQNSSQSCTKRKTESRMSTLRSQKSETDGLNTQASPSVINSRNKASRTKEEPSDSLVLSRGNSLRAQEFPRSIKNNELEPTGSRFKKRNNEDEIEEQITVVGVLKSEMALQVCGNSFHLTQKMNWPNILESEMVYHQSSNISLVGMNKFGDLRLEDVSMLNYDVRKKHGVQSLDGPDNCFHNLATEKFAVMIGNCKTIHEDDKSRQSEHFGRSSLQLATIIVKKYSGSFTAEVSKWYKESG